MILTYRFRVKDSNKALRQALRSQSSAVNYVWNYCCQIDRDAHSRYRAGLSIKRPSAFDLVKLTTGVARDLGLHSDCVGAICQKFADARRATFPATPRFRSFKRNLDWIPVTAFDRSAKLSGDVLTYQKRDYRLWLSRPIPEDAKRKSWSFSADAKDNWFVNIVVELPDAESREAGTSIGIDLGLKTFATMSNGTSIAIPQFYRKAQHRLGLAQKRGQKKAARAIHRKIAAQRRHFLHTASTKLVKAHTYIAIGDVNSASLAKTNMAKSVLDAGWSMFRQFLQYKAIAHGATVHVVSERNTSRTCSCCGVIPHSSPKGMGALGMRHWTCSDCGASHDRDINAAINILVVGAKRRPLAEEIPGINAEGRR
jgi:putative transposase